MSNVNRQDVEKSCKVFAQSLESALFNFIQTKGTVASFAEDVQSFKEKEDLFFSILFVGSSYGEFFVGINKEFAYQLIRNSELGEGCDESDIFEVFKEATNVAVGAGLETLSENYPKLTLTAPRVFSGHINLPKYQISSMEIVYPDGQLTCYSYIDHMELDLAASYSESLQNLTTAYNRISQKSAELRSAQQQKMEAERLADAKSEFLANMSHELRTPLNGMIGMLDLFKKSDLSRAQEEQLGIISRSGDFLLAIINDVLEFSKIESGKMEIEKREFDLRNCIEDLAQIMANEAYKKGLELPVYVDPEIPKYLVGDETRIRQVMINLIGNAIKFTPSGEIYINVTPLEVTDSHCKIHFEIGDTGVGIPSEKIETIFQSFMQADVSDTRKYGGTGLGLTICKSIIDAMDGSIEVESQEGEGSRFFFEVQFDFPEDRPQSKTSSIAIAVNNSRLYESLEKYLARRGSEVRRLGGIEEFASDPGYDGTILISDSSMFSSYLQEHEGDSDSNPRFDESYKILLCDPNESYDLQSKLDDIAGFKGTIVKKPIRFDELVKIIAEQPALSVEKENEILEVKTLTEQPKTHSGKVEKVLLVEDNFINQQVAVAMLELEGIECKVANNGQEGVELAKNDNFDLILMDCQMPIMDGYKATQEIRQYEESEGKRTPIIAMTANAFRSTKERCFESGMDEFITKPIKSERFLETLQKVKQSLAS